MKLKLSSRPYEISTGKVILYPKSELTIIANLTTIFSLIILLIILIISSYIHALAITVVIPLFAGAVVLYIYGAQQLVFDTATKEIHRKTFFKDKYLCGFSDVSHIELIIHPGYNIGHYRCFLKRYPKGMGIKLSVNYKEDDKYFTELSSKVIPILLSVIPDDGEELVIPPTTIHDVVFFRRAGNCIFEYKYLDYPSFLTVLLISAVFMLLTIFTELHHFFFVQLLPLIMLFRFSRIIIDRREKMIHTSFWWGLLRRKFSYAQIYMLGVASSKTQDGLLKGTSIYAIMKNDAKYLLLKKMLMEERVPRLIQEIEVLLKDDPKGGDCTV